MILFLEVLIGVTFLALLQSRWLDAQKSLFSHTASTVLVPLGFSCRPTPPNLSTVADAHLKRFLPCHTHQADLVEVDVPLE